MAIGSQEQKSCGECLTGVAVAVWPLQRCRILAGDAQGALLPLLPTYWSAHISLKLGSAVGSILGSAHQGCRWVVAPSLQLGEQINLQPTSPLSV